MDAREERADGRCDPDELSFGSLCSLERSLSRKESSTMGCFERKSDSALGTSTSGVDPCEEAKRRQRQKSLVKN